MATKYDNSYLSQTLFLPLQYSARELLWLSGIRHLEYMVKCFCCCTVESQKVRNEVILPHLPCVSVHRCRGWFFYIGPCLERERTVAVGLVLWFFYRGVDRPMWDGTSCWWSRGGFCSCEWEKLKQPNERRRRRHFALI